MFSLPRDLSRPRDEQSSDFMDRSSSRQVNILQSLVAIATLVVGYGDFSLSRNLSHESVFFFLDCIKCKI